MVDLTDRPRLGPYVLTRDLPACALGARALALHEADQTSHLLYLLPPCRDRAAERRFVQAMERIGGLDHPHLMRLEQYSLDLGGRPWMVTPYPGDAGGLVTLGRLLREKGGQMSADEAGRAVTQLLQAIQHAQHHGLRHGPLALDEVLVDRRGSLSIEWYGLERLLRGLTAGDAEMVRDEVRGMVEIGYQLITGLRAEAPLIPAARLVKRLDPQWAGWLDRGLDPSGGFDTPAEALAAMPTRRPGAERRVRGVLERLRPVGR
jgi:hypothetical protein